MEARLIDPVSLDIILEMIDAVLDLGQDLAPEDLGGVFQDLIEGFFERVDAVALGQGDDAARPQARSTNLGIEIARQMFGQARIAGDDLERRLVQLAALIELGGISAPSIQLSVACTGRLPGTAPPISS
jgi:hypothetical protein